MRFSEQNDEQLLKEAAAGQFSSFEEILQRHQQRLLSFYWRMTGSEPAARQLFSETWAELYRLRGTQAAASNVRTALFAIATRKAVRLSTENPHLGGGSSPAGPSQPGLRADQASLEYRSARMNEALLSLPLKERAALLLSFFDSLNFYDTATCLNEREENARRLAGAGLQRLLDNLGPGFFSGGLA